MGKYLKAVLIYTLAGPPIGLMVLYVMLICMSYIDSTLRITPPWRGWSNWIDDQSFFFKIGIIVSYIIGVLPALTSGLLYLYSICFLHNRYARVLSSLPIGAISILAWVGLFKDMEWFPGGSLLYTVLFGSLIALLCAGLNEWSDRALDAEPRA